MMDLPENLSPEYILLIKQHTEPTIYFATAITEKLEMLV